MHFFAEHPFFAPLVAWFAGVVLIAIDTNAASMLALVIATIWLVLVRRRVQQKQEAS